MNKARLILAVVGCGVLTVTLCHGAEPVPSPATGPAKVSAVNAAAKKIETHSALPARIPVGSGTVAAHPTATPSRAIPSAGLGTLASPNARHSAAAVDGSTVKRKP